MFLHSSACKPGLESAACFLLISMVGLKFREMIMLSHNSVWRCFVLRYLYVETLVYSANLISVISFIYFYLL